MAEPFYLSLWVRDFSEQTMLGAWAIALAEFPVSQLEPGFRELTVYPFDWGEPPVLDRSFEGSGESQEARTPRVSPAAAHAAAVAQVVALASEFLHDDYAYEAKLSWDVWVPREDAASSGQLSQWERRAVPVTISCLGPEFASDDPEERADLLVGVGLDSLLLPEDSGAGIPQEALEGVAESCYRENIEQLLGYIRRLEEKLPLTRRLLWSSSGEDLASRIRSTWEA